MPNVSRKESAKAQNTTRFCLLFVDIETVKKNNRNGVQFKKTNMIKSACIPSKKF